MAKESRTTRRLPINEMDTERVAAVQRGVDYFTQHNIKQVSSLQVKTVRLARLCQDFSAFMSEHPLVRAFITMESVTIEIDDMKPHPNYFDWFNVRQKGTTEYFMVPAFTAVVLNMYMEILG